MRYSLLSVFLFAAVVLTGCEEFQTEESAVESSPEVTETLCHIARIGNLAEMPDNLWEEQGTEKNISFYSLPTPPSALEVSPNAAIGDEVDPDILAIVESTAKESTSSEGLKKTREKESELELAIEMVDEVQKKEFKADVATELNPSEEETDETDESADEKVDEETDEENEEVAISMSDENKEEKETEEVSEVDEDSDVSEDSEDSEDLKEAEEISEAKVENEEENQTEDSSENKESAAEKKVQKTGLLEDELERQAEKFLNILKETPKEVREELKNARFQKVTFRLVKVPGPLVQGTLSEEFYIVRTMEYTGSNLSHDFQTLSLSPNYANWTGELEKYLEIMTLDSLHHECWVEAPEFWNSDKE